MFATLKKTALSALVALTAFTAVPAVAQADSLYLGFGPDGGSVRYLDRDYRDRDWRRDGGRRDCTPSRALNKADRLGINRARIDYVNRRVIAVRGRDDGRRVLVRFARAPGCPIIR